MVKKIKTLLLDFHIIRAFSVKTHVPIQNLTYCVKVASVSPPFSHFIFNMHLIDKIKNKQYLLVKELDLQERFKQVLVEI